MKHIKCLFTEKQLEIEKLRNKPYHRVTHNKVYEVYSIEGCDEDEFWIICDDPKQKVDFSWNKLKMMSIL